MAHIIHIHSARGQTSHILKPPPQIAGWPLQNRPVMYHSMLPRLPDPFRGLFPKPHSPIETHPECPMKKKKVKTRKRKRGGNPSHKRSQISAPQPRRRPCSQPAIYGISFPQQKCNLLSNTVRRLPNRCQSRPKPPSIRSEISAGSLLERPLLIVPVRKREKKRENAKS